MRSRYDSTPAAFRAVLAENWGRRVTGGIVVGLLALVTISENLAAYVWHWPGWPGAILGVVTIGWFVASLPFATYRTWKEARDEASESRAALSATVPQFAAQILGLQWDMEQRNTQPFFMVAIVGITNRGADGGIASFDARAADGDGKALTARIVHPDNAFDLAQDDGGRRFYEPQHFLSARIVEVRRHVPVVGAVQLLFPSVSDYDGPLTVNPSTVEIVIYDTYGIACIAKPVEPAELPPTRIFPGLPPPIYGKRNAES